MFFAILAGGFGLAGVAILLLQLRFARRSKPSFHVPHVWKCPVRGLYHIRLGDLFLHGWDKKQREIYRYDQMHSLAWRDKPNADQILAYFQRRATVAQAVDDAVAAGKRFIDKALA